MSNSEVLSALFGLLLGVLASAFGVVFESRRREREIRDALVTELRENLATLARHRVEKWPMPLTDGAWQLAKGTRLGAEQRNRLIAAYGASQRYNFEITAAYRLATAASSQVADFQRVVAANVDPGPAETTLHAALKALQR